MLIRPERILAIDPIEANVGPVAVAVRESPDVALAVDGSAVDGVDVVEAFVSFDVEVLLA